MCPFGIKTLCVDKKTVVRTVCFLLKKSENGVSEQFFAPSVYRVNNGPPYADPKVEIFMTTFKHFDFLKTAICVFAIWEH